MPRPLVVGLGPVPPATVEPILGDVARFHPDPTPADIAEAVGVIARATAVLDGAFLASAPRLQVVARTGVGVDLVDVETATQLGIPVVITPGSGSRAVAESVLAMTLHLVKRLGPLTTLVREGRWSAQHTISIGDLDGATIGIVGFGRIGRRVGELAQAFGMRVLAHDPISPPPPEVACADLHVLAAASDVLTLHVPLTEATRNLADAELFAHVRAGAVLVNCGRGGLLDLDDTHAALVSGRLSGVGLDVYDPEPASYHPLFDHPDVVLTPHVASLSRRAQAATFADAARGVRDVLTGAMPAAVANPRWVDRRPPGRVDPRSTLIERR